MARGRSIIPRSSSPFTFPNSLLPVLHPPRLRRQSTNLATAEATISGRHGTSHLPSVRSRRRRSTVSLPDVENAEAGARLRSKRRPTISATPLSPKALNTDLAGHIPAETKMAEMSVKDLSDFQFMDSLIQPPSIDQIFASPRSPTLELSFDEEIPAPVTYSHELEPQPKGVVFIEPYSEPEFEDLATQLEEITVRGARSRAQQRERVARRWESLCGTRIRFLKEQAAHALMIAEMTASATPPPLADTTLFDVVGASSPLPSPNPAPPSPLENYGAPLTRMSSSPYLVCGETLDLAAVSSSSGREELEALCDAISTDSRALVERMIENLHRIDYDDIGVDGLTETECRQLRAESRKRRRLDRQRAFELGVLLELKRRQIGRSRSSSASSSDSSINSELECDQPASPPMAYCPVETVDHLVAKMHMKRKETGQRHFTSSIAAREVFDARGCSRLRVATSPVVEMRVKVARRRSHSTKPAFFDGFVFSSAAFGLGSVSWLMEKRRLTSLDLE